MGMMRNLDQDPRTPVLPPSRTTRQLRGHRAGPDGRAAEARVAARYERAGWSVVARNWRAPRGVGGGEIDIVARRGDSVAVIEVKRRATLAAASSALAPAQRRRLEISAVFWAEAASAEHCEMTIDLAAVDRSGRVEVYRNVTMD